jgi:hypothetical protein
MKCIAKEKNTPTNRREEFERQVIAERKTTLIN